MAQDQEAEKCILHPDATVRDAIEVMHSSNRPAVAIVGDNRRLVGLFTNGDMRKFFLAGGNLSQSIQEAMNPAPLVFHSQAAVESRKESAPLIVYPLVDECGRLLSLIFEDSVVVYDADSLKGVPLVVMAGGKGTRLYPYTKVLPKALMPIGDYTISERIIEQFYRYGCRDVWFVLNYRGAMIKAYFDSLETDYRVSYVTEDAFRGTGGGLALLKGKVDGTFCLSNCDIIVRDDLSCAYQTHKSRGDVITYVCAMMNFAIPYGVVETDGQGFICSMREKPQMNYLVNTGVYIVEPEVLDLIEGDESVDFPELAQRVIDRGGKVGVFPIPQESWIDIGETGKMKDALSRVEREE